jgi:5-(carboxyamino)imidazole ribonucleotide synthase
VAVNWVKCYYLTLENLINNYVLDLAMKLPQESLQSIFQRNLMDFETVYQFGKLVDVLTFEIELVNIEALEKLE